MSTFPRAPRLPILLAAALCGLAAAPRPTPTPPTPAPVLGGGFGKTPAAGGTAGRSAPKKKVRLTNETLVTESDKGKVSTSDVKAARTPTPRAGEPTPQPTAADAAAPAPVAEGEAYWRDEARRLRERPAALKETIARLDAEVKKLESDFYSWDDGSYRDRVIKPAWDKAREDLATARKELPVAEQELADLPDRARKAGALPGWLRE